MPPERIYLVRHGIAVDSEVWGREDDQRPLTPVGEKRVAQAARGLKRLEIQADRVLSSPLPRAWRTAEIASKILRMTNLLEAAPALSADHGAEEIKRFLMERPERIVMAVGHNMAFSALIGHLIGNGNHGALVTELRKGGVAALRLAENDRYLLEWLMTPKILRQLAKVP